MLCVMKSHRGMYDALVERDKGKLKEWVREDLKQAAGVIIPFLLDSHEPERAGGPWRKENSRAHFPNTAFSRSRVTARMK